MLVLLLLTVEGWGGRAGNGARVAQVISPPCPSGDREAAAGGGGGSRRSLCATLSQHTAVPVSGAQINHHTHNSPRHILRGRGELQAGLPPVCAWHQQALNGERCNRCSGSERSGGAIERPGVALLWLWLEIRLKCQWKLLGILYALGEMGNCTPPIRGPWRPFE